MKKTITIIAKNTIEIMQARTLQSFDTIAVFWHNVLLEFQFFSCSQKEALN
jgi:hypothetical protein